MLFIYTENPEILVGKWNGTYHSIWNILDIIGYQLNVFFFYFNFPIDTSTFCHTWSSLTMILWFFYFAFGQAAALHIYTKFPPGWMV